MTKLIGSICLSDIPHRLMKKVMCKDGKERVYLSLAVVERKSVGDHGDTHFISCEPRQEDRREGERYIIGNLKPLVFESNAPTEEQIRNAASVDAPPF